MKTIKIILASTYTVGFLGGFAWVVVTEKGFLVLLQMVGLVSVVMLFFLCLIYLIALFLDP